MKKHYTTWKLASKAAKKLRIKNASDYQKNRVKDPMLPSNPNYYFDADWNKNDGWYGFLGKKKPSNKYQFIGEASLAARKLGFINSMEYLKGYKKDPRLPMEPKSYYEDWPNEDGWRIFLGLEKPAKRYESWKTASDAAAACGIKTLTEYKLNYKKDPRLPAHPEYKYADVWKQNGGFFGFFKKKIPIAPYKTWDEAKAAVLKLGISASKEYPKLYHLDKCLPSNPAQVYESIWRDNNGWSGFLNKPVHFTNWHDAAITAQNLGCKSRYDYSKKRKNDPRLPSDPPAKYSSAWKINGGWFGFLNRSKPYSSWHQAHKAVIIFNFSSRTAYRKGHKVDPKLPSRPDIVFSKHWTAKGSWRGFLGLPHYYQTIKEASNAIKYFGFQCRADYKRGHNQNPQLHPNPDLYYHFDWEAFGGWYQFLGLIKPYETWDEASSNAKKLQCKNVSDYLRRFHLDPRLPKNPKFIFRKVWVRNGLWESYLGLPKKQPRYKTWEEASHAAIAIGIKSGEQYRELCDLDFRLPRTPNEVYSSEWKIRGGWFGFLNIPKQYPTWQQAHEATVKVRIVSPLDYKKRRLTDPRLPSTPHLYYSSEWELRGGWEAFLLPDSCETLKDAKLVVKILAIRDSSEYRSRYKNYSQLPAHPERVFNNEWIDWYEFCDIPKPYSFTELQKIAKKENIQTSLEYKNYVTRTRDPRLLKNPDQVYRDQWINWHLFLGKTEPYTTKSIRDPYLAWKESIVRFMKTARGGVSKTNSLCRFVRDYIIKHALGYKPEEFLCREFSAMREFKQFIESQSTEFNKQIIFKSVIEFLNNVIIEELTIEDERTGQLELRHGARNPFNDLKYRFESDKKILFESNKPALAYQYVRALKHWIFPVNAKHYSDLCHIQIFDADWVTVDQNIIDQNDEDCVYKIEHGSHKMWIPTMWTLLYAITHTAARGRQLAYNDSGEADKIIPIFKNDELIWIENVSKLTGLTKDQGFIKRLGNDSFGMYFTSNKSSIAQEGYTVPWMPIELAYWIIKLRDWQTKYNPLSSVTSWVDLNNTNLNEAQRRIKGSNCFLFREFNENSPLVFSGKLTRRLAAGLYNTQPEDMQLAEHRGNKSSLNGYSSKYTPHALRVSLITALLFEFGIPLEWVMKLVGHSTVIMTIYYGKPSNTDIRKCFDEGEKKALRDNAYAKQRMIEQNRIEEIKSELVSTSEEALLSLSGITPGGNYLFRDYGFCPNSGTRCFDGGDLSENTNERLSVQNGYLGTQNCLRCRHFITGPAFIGGLLSVCNEISFACKIQAEKHSALSNSIQSIMCKIESENNKEYDYEKSGNAYDKSSRHQLNLRKRKLQSEQESAAKKLDMYLCDLHSAYKLLQLCQKLMNKLDDKNEEIQLVTTTDRDIVVTLEDSSNFRQVSEICENAEIYESSNCDLAIFSRSQLLDKMASINKVDPQLFMLTKEQQLSAGNQMTRLLLSRLKTWDSVNAVVDGRALLDDLSISKIINKNELFSSVNTIRLEVLGEVT